MRTYSPGAEGSLVRIKPEYLERVSEELLSSTESVNKALFMYIVFRDRLLDQVRDIFSEAELGLLVDNQNGVIMSPKASKAVFIASLEDGFKFEGLGEKWGVGLAELKGKINRLTRLELSFLLSEIESFWNCPHELNLATFITKFSNGKEEKEIDDPL